MTILSQDGVVRVIYLPFYSRVQFSDPHDVLTEEWHLIEDWMTDKNKAAPSGSKGAYFTSFDFWWYDVSAGNSTLLLLLVIPILKILKVPLTPCSLHYTDQRPDAGDCIFVGWYCIMCGGYSRPIRITVNCLDAIFCHYDCIRTYVSYHRVLYNAWFERKILTS